MLFFLLVIGFCSIQVLECAFQALLLINGIILNVCRMAKLADNSDDSRAHWSLYYSFGTCACFTITSQSFMKFSFHVNVLIYLTFNGKL